MAVDLRAAWLCSRRPSRICGAARGGRIVNFSDWVARSGRPRYAGLPDVLRRQGGRHRADRGAGAGAGGGSDPGQRRRARADRRAPGHVRRGVRRGRARDAARALGRRNRDRQGGAGARRERLHHRRDHPRGRRPAPEVMPNSSGALSSSALLDVVGLDVFFRGACLHLVRCARRTATHATGTARCRIPARRPTAGHPCACSDPGTPRIPCRCGRPRHAVIHVHELHLIDREAVCCVPKRLRPVA